jgi:membrane protein DedA with SNARE-associated domain
VSRDALKWDLLGSLIILFFTTIFSYAGWANLFTQDEDILSFLQVVSLLATAVAAVGLIVTRKPPEAN